MERDLLTQLVYVDAFEPIPLVDSFVKFNKVGKGKGEARLYLGSENKESIFDFFEGQSFSVNCFVLKQDLIDYLNQVKDEYIHHTFYYRDKNYVSINKWEEYKQYIEAKDDIIEFVFARTQTADTDSRIYGREPSLNVKERTIGADIYDYIRSIAIPIVSYIHFIKYKYGNNYVFYTKLDYEPVLTIQKEYTFKKDVQVKLEKKYKHTYSYYRTRPEQRKFRSDLLKSIGNKCPITGISDDFLLEACHIKPYNKCTPKERKDINNGLLLCPNLHVVFDLGYISFDNEKRLLISPYLRKDTRKRLGIEIGKIYNDLPFNPDRLINIQYHRDNVFKKIDFEP